ncbi:conserved hypothetical protein [Shewanella halifaxensis HAW-EB4]|uniref:Lipoprotein n=1 Tax=Shewanella halifaxensis (strain HAW-EB4) TaxID=458817 RepID=B0TN72_SHEHH|nr:hypothetical protein [Shewanella halifaxensis]ABZ74784.1 conserved hypothetical protein [Shewanella halifaxensis HAW-EB4]
MKRISVILLALLALNSMACSSTTVANAGCDFVSGAHRNEQQREQREQIGQSSVASTQDNKDVEVGILNAILGVFSRQLNDDTECL